MSVTKFEMAVATLLMTFLAAQKDLHFIKFRPPFSTVGSFSEVRFRGSHYEAWSNATSVDVSKNCLCVFLRTEEQLWSIPMIWLFVTSMKLYKAKI